MGFKPAIIGLSTRPRHLAFQAPSSFLWWRTASSFLASAYSHSFLRVAFTPCRILNGVKVGGNTGVACGRGESLTASKTVHELLDWP